MLLFAGCVRKTGRAKSKTTRASCLQISDCEASGSSLRRTGESDMKALACVPA